MSLENDNFVQNNNPEKTVEQTVQDKLSSDSQIPKTNLATTMPIGPGVYLADGTKMFSYGSGKLYVCPDRSRIVETVDLNKTTIQKFYESGAKALNENCKKAERQIFANGSIREINYQGMVSETIPNQNGHEKRVFDTNGKMLVQEWLDKKGQMITRVFPDKQGNTIQLFADGRRTITYPNGSKTHLNIDGREIRSSVAKTSQGVNSVRPSVAEKQQTVIPKTPEVKTTKSSLNNTKLAKDEAKHPLPALQLESKENKPIESEIKKEAQPKSLIKEEVVSESEMLEQPELPKAEAAKAEANSKPLELKFDPKLIEERKRAISNAFMFGDLNLPKITDADLFALTQLPIAKEIETLHIPPDADISELSEAGIAQLKHLEWLTELSIPHGAVKDSWLAQIGEMTKLKVLEIGQSKDPKTKSEITDNSLVHLQSLTELKTLRLNNSKITDKGLEKLKGFNQLETLSLKGADIKGKGLTHLKGLPKLLNLDLSYSSVNDKDLVYIKDVRPTTLNLDNTQITDGAARHIRYLSSLENLSLSGTRISDQGLDYLKSLYNLQELNLSNTQITDKGLASLEPMKDLQFLYLNKTKISGSGLAHLSGHKNLSFLELQDTALHNDHLKHLGNMSSLKRIDLSHTNVDSTLPKQLEKLRKLETLVLIDAIISSHAMDTLKANTKIHIER